MSAYKNYFDGIDTNANTAAECGEIRSKAAKIKKRRKIATSAVGVTLAVMMTTTVAVSAVGGWDITEIIGRWFKGNAASITDNLSVVTAENTENQFEFLDIAPNGAVIDDNMIIFFIDVTRNDGNVFDCAEYDMTKKDGSIFYGFDGETVPARPRYDFSLIELNFLIDETIEGYVTYNHKYGVPSRQYLVDDGSPNDNKITIAFCCDRAAIESQMGEIDKMIIGSNVIDISDTFSYKITGVDLRLGSLSGHRNNVLYQDEVSKYYNVDGFTSERIIGLWKSKLKFDIRPAKTITIEPNRESAFQVYTNSNENGVHSFNVKNITLSQMSINYELEGDAPEKDSFLENWKIGEIIMKNGDTLTIMPDSYVPSLQSEHGNQFYHDQKTWFVRGSIMLTEPIDPDKVAAVRLGDTTFPIE
ncbi:MAG: hypothetical protein K2N71_04170 [Oscillospiraceae bacterium]|nr:hypothetical protein [Oscillospiraceae bacterium]